MDNAQQTDNAQLERKIKRSNSEISLLKERIKKLDKVIRFERMYSSWLLNRIREN